jgi:hypothetical protein
MQIFVKNHDLGFWTQHEITAQKFEKIDGEMELVWCNHAGAITEELENCDYRSEGTDWVTKQYIHVCDKSLRPEMNIVTIGENAPENGVYDDLLD